MAENGTVAAPQQPTTQQPQQEQHCSGNCKQCTLFQRQYCASQLALTNMRMLERMTQQMQMMQMHLDDIDKKVEAQQNGESSLIDPIAQKGSGAGE